MHLLLRPLPLLVLIVPALGSCGAGVEPAAPAEPAPETKVSEPTAEPATPETSEPSEAPATDEPAAPAARSGDAVAATVDGHRITEAEVSARAELIVRQQTGGMPVPEAQLQAMTETFRPQVLEYLIDDFLLDREIERREIELSTEEVVGYLEHGLQVELSLRGSTKEELSEQIRAARGVGLEEYIEEQAQNEELLQGLRQAKLIEATYPDELAITEEEIQARYEEALAGGLSVPAKVHARHILIGADESASEEEHAAARARAEELAVQAQAEGADFAALARENSSCPSSAQGGDLGSFTAPEMVAPFSEAAFALEVGEVSGVVETPFGYHVIRCEEQLPERVVPLEIAGPWLQDELRLQKVGPLRERYVESLRAEAEIERAGQG